MTSWTDLAVHWIGVACLCGMAIAAAYAIISTVAEHADQIRDALYGHPTRDRYDNAVSAVDADLSILDGRRTAA